MRKIFCQLVRATLFACLMASPQVCFAAHPRHVVLPPASSSTAQEAPEGSRLAKFLAAALLTVLAGAGLLLAKYSNEVGDLSAQIDVLGQELRTQESANAELIIERSELKKRIERCDCVVSAKDSALTQASSQIEKLERQVHAMIAADLAITEKAARWTAREARHRVERLALDQGHDQVAALLSEMKRGH